jgi:hypothetical protein
MLTPLTLSLPYTNCVEVGVGDPEGEAVVFEAIVVDVLCGPVCGSFRTA